MDGHAYEVWSLAFSPDGNILATVGGNWPKGVGEVKLWNVAERRQRATLTGHADAVTCVAFSPDGKTLATATRGGRARALPLERLTAEVKLWDMDTLQARFTRSAQTAALYALAFTPDGKTVAAGGYEAFSNSGTIKVWDVATGKDSASPIEHAVAVSAIALSPDGKTLATATLDYQITLWDMASQAPRQTWSGHVGPIYAMEFAPDGTTLATSGTVQDHTVRLWQTLAPLEEIRLNGVPYNGAQFLAFAPDGKTLWGWHSGRSTQWDMVTGQERTVNQELFVALDRGGTVLATLDGLGAVKLRDVATMQVRAVMEPQGELPDQAPKPAPVAGAERTNRGLPHMLGRDTLAVLASQRKRITAVAVSFESGCVATAGATWINQYSSLSPDPGEIRLSNVRTAKNPLLLKAHANRVTALAFSPSGKRLVSASEDAVIVWDTDTGQSQATLKGPFKGALTEIQHLAFAPDGKSLAATSADQNIYGAGRILIWDTAACKLQASLLGHAGPISCLAFSPDSQTLASPRTSVSPAARGFRPLGAYRRSIPVTT